MKPIREGGRQRRQGKKLGLHVGSPGVWPEPDPMGCVLGAGGQALTGSPGIKQVRWPSQARVQVGIWGLLKA